MGELTWIFLFRLPSATVMDKLKETESSNALQLHLKNCDEDNTNVNIIFLLFNSVSNQKRPDNPIKIIGY